MMGWSPGCYIPSYVEIGPLVPKKIFEGFLSYKGVVLVPKKIFEGFLSYKGVVAILVM